MDKYPKDGSIFEQTMKYVENADDPKPNRDMLA